MSNLYARRPGPGDPRPQYHPPVQPPPFMPWRNQRASVDSADPPSLGSGPRMSRSPAILPIFPPPPTPIPQEDPAPPKLGVTKHQARQDSGHAYRAFLGVTGHVEKHSTDKTLVRGAAPHAVGIAQKQNGAFTSILSVAWVFILLVYGFGTELPRRVTDPTPAEVQEAGSMYAMYQQVAIMLLIGFGFLMTFLRRYAYGALGYTFLVTIFVVLWGILCTEWLLACIKDYTEEEALDGTRHCLEKIQLSLPQMINGMFAAAAVMISFGGVLGKVTVLQLFLMAIIEVCFYSVNLMIGEGIFDAMDVGGSMFIHMFGAYFGLAVCRCLQSKGASGSAYNKSSVDHDIFSVLPQMIGTLFLWICWPAFNAAFAGKDQELVMVNTILSLCASCVATFLLSGGLGKGKFDMVHCQNATLAGGVAMGAPATMILNPAWALLVGTCAGGTSVLGYKYLSPIMSSFGVHDTCGIHNLHGMPAIIGTLASIAAAGLYISEHQSRMQAAAFGVTMGIALFGGTVTGTIISRLEGVSDEEMFKDDAFWADIEAPTHPLQVVQEPCSEL